jgi:hypothetical protein
VEEFPSFRCSKVTASQSSLANRATGACCIRSEGGERMLRYFRRKVRATHQCELQVHWREYADSLGTCSSTAPGSTIIVKLFGRKRDNNVGIRDQVMQSGRAENSSCGQHRGTSPSEPLRVVCLGGITRVGSERNSLGFTDVSSVPLRFPQGAPDIKSFIIKCLIRYLVCAGSGQN